MMEVAGVQAPNTLRAKTGDLGSFVQWMVESSGRADIEDWLPRDTHAYLNHLERKKRAPASINRAYASIRRFVRWAQEEPGGVFLKHGLPTRGTVGLATGEPDAVLNPKKKVWETLKPFFKTDKDKIATFTREAQVGRMETSKGAIYSDFAVDAPIS